MPHYQPAGAEFHVMFRLAGSLPREAIERLRAERTRLERASFGCSKDPKRVKRQREAYFAKFDKLLNSSATGPRWLEIDKVAEIVAEAIDFRDNREYDLYSFTIMPNHVHLVARFLGGEVITKDVKPNVSYSPVAETSHRPSV